MITSILNDCLLVRREPEKLREYLERVNVTLFNDIFEELEPLEAHQTVLYIVCGFSEDSPLLIARQDSKEEKMGICEFLDIPDFLRKDLMNLKRSVVRGTTTAYLQQFAGPLFRTLMFLKIQHNDLELDVTNRSACVKKIEEKDGATTTTETFDYKEHGKAITEMIRLGKEIEKLEKQIIDQVKRMDGLEEMRDFMSQAKKKGQLSGGRRGNVELCIT